VLLGANRGKQKVKEREAREIVQTWGGEEPSENVKYVGRIYMKTPAKIERVRERLRSSFARKSP